MNNSSIIIGSHVNFKENQLLGAAEQAVSYGANAFMFYTGAPQNTVRKSIDETYTNKALEYLNAHNISLDNVICHAPYIINLANKEAPEKWNFSISFLKNELARIRKMNVKYMVLHPGNSLKQERSTALKNIADALNIILEDVTDEVILLETMAGKGTECGKTVEELKYIIDRVEKQDNIGVCLDTCHLHDSGIDITAFEAYLDEFALHLSLDKIKCIHLNDSKNERGSHKDRHENIGYGQIGFNALLDVCYNERLKNVPKILETPWVNDKPLYKEEIKNLKEKVFNELY